MICSMHGLALCPGKGISVLSPEQAEEGAVPRTCVRRELVGQPSLGSCGGLFWGAVRPSVRG